MNLKKHNLVPDILKITKYSGTPEPRKVISASMLGDEMLKIFYRVKHGIIDEQSIFGSNTLGTLVHSGLDKIAEDNDRYEVAVRHEIQYKDTEWVLSAEVDILDHEIEAIYDAKTAWHTTKKFDQDNGYAWQMRLQKYIFKKVDKKYSTYDLFIFFIYKTKKQIKKFLTDETSIIEVDQYHDDIIEYKIDVITQTIDAWLEDESLITQCEDLWWRSDENGEKYPSKCTKYCSYNKVCKFYREDGRFEAKVKNTDW